MDGTKSYTEAADERTLWGLFLVGERSTVGRRETVRTPGRRGSDNAGTSSDKVSENLIRRKPKVSWGREIRPGLGGT